MEVDVVIAQRVILKPSVLCSERAQGRDVSEQNEVMEKESQTMASP